MSDKAQESTFRRTLGRLLSTAPKPHKPREESKVGKADAAKRQRPPRHRSEKAD